MKYFGILFLFAFSINCFSQDTITTAKVNEYMDKEVCVLGKVVSFKLVLRGNSLITSTLINPIPTVFSRL